MTTAGEINEQNTGSLPGLIGMEVLEVRPGLLTARLEVRPELMTPHGYLHGATIVALADTSCGWGTLTNLPEGAQSFTTVELKSNFFGTARGGVIGCEAKLAHGGRTTQVWDAVVTTGEGGKTIALFRCTQMILYPHERQRAGSP